jgi:hypothetical protein
MKRLTLHHLTSSLHRCQHYINPYRNRQNKQSKTFQDICKGKDDDVFRLCYGNDGNNKFFGKLPLEFIAPSLLSVIFFVKALRQWRQIHEAMKQGNVKYSKKFKQ